VTGVVVHHHLGLGDHFVCNGLVNHLAEEHDVVYLPCKRANHPTVACLYSEQPKVEVFPVDHEHADVASFARRMHAPVLRVGFERCARDRFDLSFYEQLQIPFAYRYAKFRLPERIPHEDEVYDALADAGGYSLVHREASLGRYRLRIDSRLPIVEIRNRTTPPAFRNLLSYRTLIQRAVEIHCINSSVVHLANSIDVRGRLFYHDVRKRNFHLDARWTTVEYHAPLLHEAAARARRLFEGESLP
jgi:hypothetical protein